VQTNLIAVTTGRRTRRIATLVAAAGGVLAIAFASGISSAADPKPVDRATGSSAQTWLKETWRSAATLEEEIARTRANRDKAGGRRGARRALGVLSVKAAGALEAALALGRRDVVAQMEDLVRVRLTDTRSAVSARANAGEADALFALGLYDARGLLGQADPTRACASFARAATLGHVAGRYHAALCVLEADPARAGKLMQAAANAGHPAAQETVGRACLGGQKSGAGSDCARIYISAAAQAGRTSAQSLLGWMYATGTGVEKDVARATELYVQAAKAGDVAAQNNLGEFFENGTGVPLDLEQATGWYEMAAQAGFAPAQFNLGRVYAVRVSVVGDKEPALAWLSRAHGQGLEPALELMRWLEKKTPRLKLSRELGARQENSDSPSRSENAPLRLKMIDVFLQSRSG
jgi:TPR repeat protein